MGARNFATPNASKHYVIFETEFEFETICRECGHEHDFCSSEDDCPTICEECGSDNLKTIEYIEREVSYHDDDKLYMQEFIKENLPEMTEINFESDGNRSYPTIFFGEIERSKAFAGLYVDYKIKIGFTCGYYEAAILDWFIDTDVDEALDEWEYYVDLNEGMKKIQRENIIKWFEQVHEEMTSEIEKAFEKASPTKLTLLGTFSNGEGVYVNAN